MTSGALPGNAFSRWRTPLLALALAAVAACQGAQDDPRRPAGEPLAGLTEPQLAQFYKGRELFDRSWTPEEGLGPLYMQASCGSCHDLPNIGGAGVEPLKEATYWDSINGCDILKEEGGPLVQDHATPLLQAEGIFYERKPPSANGYLIMEAPALYGLGLIEAIPDETILSRADPDDADGDGITGRASWLPDGRLGRLGNKSYRATIIDLSEGAFRRSLGLTTPRYPTEEMVNGMPLPPGTDPVPDPEFSQENLEAVADYIRYLAPALPRDEESGAALDTLEWGRQLFHQLGCSSCHVPSMVTGPNEVEALANKRIFLYSDLLLHDLDPDRPTICGPTATPSEVRTARLMGLRYRSRFMHDLRAVNVDQALRMHGGEAAAVGESYSMLGGDRRGFLLRFLMSL